MSDHQPLDLAYAAACLDADLAIPTTMILGPGFGR